MHMVHVHLCIDHVLTSFPVSRLLFMRDDGSARTSSDGPHYVIEEVDNDYTQDIYRYDVISSKNPGTLSKHPGAFIRYLSYVHTSAMSGAYEPCKQGKGVSNWQGHAELMHVLMYALHGDTIVCVHAQVRMPLGNRLQLPVDIYSQVQPHCLLWQAFKPHS